MKTLPTLSLLMADKSECQLQHIEPNLPSGLCQYVELKSNSLQNTPKNSRGRRVMQIAMKAFDVPPNFARDGEKAV